MAKDFLVEIGLEELPARFVDPALEQFKDTAAAVFQENRLQYEEIHPLGTPRRLALLVKGLAEQQEALVEEVKGPAQKVAFKDGEPTKAAYGFARSQGVDVEELVVKAVGHVDYVFAVKKEEGRPARDLLSEIIPALVGRLHFSKSMRWADLEFRFARPIRWLVALYGKEVVPFTIAGVESGRVSYGHRFLSGRAVEIEGPAAYRDVMEKEYVIAGPGERKKRIRSQIEQLAAEAGGKVLAGEELLNEVNNLVEYPAALCGSFAREYLELPPEVLVTTMQEHQRFFPVQSPAGELKPLFISVSNGGDLEVVRRGNEKVLKARLDDASFFWQEDLRVSLDSRVEQLKKVVFQESLGTVHQKMERVQQLAEYLISILSSRDEDIKITERAAYLSKADLVTNMVYEFPELQGIMGREYALRSGEKPEVARAIFEHYLPRHAGDDLPQSLPGKALSLADKMDTLAGCFAIGMQPTGSQDPYALRRQALGVCHIIIDCGPGLSLETMINRAYEKISAGAELQKGQEEVQESLNEFFHQRLRGILRERGMAYDTVEAVLQAQPDDIADTCLRGEALEEFRQKPGFDELITAYGRVSNLSKKAPQATFNTNLLEAGAEKKLYDFYTELEQKVSPAAGERDYGRALEYISMLKEPVDEYFDEVMVMVDDPAIRDNRLAMLREISRFMETVADLDKIVVEKVN